MKRAGLLWLSASRPSRPSPPAVRSPNRRLRRLQNPRSRGRGWHGRRRQERQEERLRRSTLILPGCSRNQRRNDRPTEDDPHSFFVFACGQHAARQFLAEESTFAAWRQQVPDHFLFSVKARRFLTHMKRLRNPDEPLARLFFELLRSDLHWDPCSISYPGTS